MQFYHVSRVGAIRGAAHLLWIGRVRSKCSVLLSTATSPEHRIEPRSGFEMTISRLLNTDPVVGNGCLPSPSQRPVQKKNVQLLNSCSDVCDKNDGVDEAHATAAAAHF